MTNPETKEYVQWATLAEKAEVKGRADGKIVVVLLQTKELAREGYRALGRGLGEPPTVSVTDKLRSRIAELTQQRDEARVELEKLKFDASQIEVRGDSWRTGWPYFVIRKRDDEPVEVVPFEQEDAARIAWEQMQTQWTETFLVKVVRDDVPEAKETQAMPEKPAVDRIKTDLRALVALFRNTAKGGEGPRNYVHGEFAAQSIERLLDQVDAEEGTWASQTKPTTADRDKPETWPKAGESVFAISDGTVPGMGPWGAVVHSPSAWADSNHGCRWVRVADVFGEGA